LSEEPLPEEEEPEEPEDGLLLGLEALPPLVGWADLPLWEPL
jgi:hypothetical protein